MQDLCASIPGENSLQAYRCAALCHVQEVKREKEVRASSVRHLFLKIKPMRSDTTLHKAISKYSHISEILCAQFQTTTIKQMTPIKSFPSAYKSYVNRITVVY